MKCAYCEKEFNQEAERQEYNDQHKNGPTYDELGFGLVNICMDCRVKSTKQMISEMKIRL